MFKKISCSVLAIFAALSTFTGVALAALSTEQQAFADGVTGMITDWSAWGWIALLAIMTFMIGAKLAKKFSGKAT